MVLPRVDVSNISVRIPKMCTGCFPSRFALALGNWDLEMRNERIESDFGDQNERLEDDLVNLSLFINHDIKPRFNIVYENGPTIVVNKQPGVLTQAPPGVDSIEARVREFFNLREGRVGKRYLGLPHRLDRPASGLLVMTRHVRAARRLSDQFQERSVTKKYWALVEGIVSEDHGTWYDYMRKIPGRAESEIVSPTRPDAREAILHFRVLKLFEKTSWLEIELETGRTHQIRLQCSSRGFPLLGDELYGSSIPFGEQFEDCRERAIALHSREMSFVDFLRKERVTLHAPLYSAWREWVDAPDGEAFIDEMFLTPKPFTTKIFGDVDDSSIAPRSGVKNV